MKKLLWLLVGVGLILGAGCATQGTVTLKADNPEGEAVPFIIWYQSNLTDSTYVMSSTSWETDITVELSGDKVEGMIMKNILDTTNLQEDLHFEILFNGKTQTDKTITLLSPAAQFSLTIQRGM
jgi:hypothetical protein